jgi:hypothetical protein
MRYLIITYVRKANGQIDEQCEVSKKTKERDITTANVILDYKDKKVVKCMIDGQVITMDWNKAHEYYKRAYPSIIERLEVEAVQE